MKTICNLRHYYSRGTVLEAILEESGQGTDAKTVRKYGHCGGEGWGEMAGKKGQGKGLGANGRGDVRDKRQSLATMATSGCK